MTTIRKIITDGYREAGIIGLGEDPDADQLDEGLRRLQGMYASLFGNELGENLSPVNFGTSGLTNSYAKDLDASQDITSVYIPSNIRLIFNNSAVTTLYLPPNPQDGARVGVIDNTGNFATYNVTLNGNGRRVETFTSVVLNTNSLNREWFYRGDLGTWVRVADLDVDLASPLPPEFDDLLITILALRINPRNGAETKPELTGVLADIRKKFRARYHQTLEMPCEDGITVLTLNKRLTFGIARTPIFNIGR